MKTLHRNFSIAALLAGIVMSMSSCVKVDSQSKQFKFSFAPQSFIINRSNEDNADITATITVNTDEFLAAAASQGISVNDFRHIYITGCKVYTTSLKLHTLGDFSACTVNVPMLDELYDNPEMASGVSNNPEATTIELEPTALDFVDIMREKTFEMNVVMHQSHMPLWAHLPMAIQFDVDVNGTVITGQ